MEILRTKDELGHLEVLREKQPLVLVPTMGALHAGHLSLVRLAQQYGTVVVSIFVNPTQFGPTEDLAAYPRNLEHDLDLLAPLAVDAVFVPDVKAMYHRQDEVTIVPGCRARGLCGASRPGHFGGVLTIVAKLFGLIRPDWAVFGRKDAQQCLVIAQMVEELHLRVKLVDAPTVREPDGLAMSSRNRYLVGPDRTRALCLQNALQSAFQQVADGERNVDAVEKLMLESLSEADSVDYVAVREVPDLDKPARMSGRTLLAVAAQVGPARLIDNLVLDVGEDEVVPTGLLTPGPQ